MGGLKRRLTCWVRPAEKTLKHRKMKRIVLSAALTAVIGWVALVLADGWPTAPKSELKAKAGSPAESLPTAWRTIVADAPLRLAKRRLSSELLSC